MDLAAAARADEDDDHGLESAEDDGRDALEADFDRAVVGTDHREVHLRQPPCKTASASIVPPRVKRSTVRPAAAVERAIIARMPEQVLTHTPPRSAAHRLLRGARLGLPIFLGYVAGRRGLRHPRRGPPASRAGQAMACSALRARGRRPVRRAVAHALGGGPGGDPHRDRRRQPALRAVRRHDLTVPARARRCRCRRRSPSRSPTRRSP